MSKDDDWAYKPWGGETKQDSIFDTVTSHYDYGSSPSANWGFETNLGGSNESGGLGSSNNNGPSWAYSTNSESGGFASQNSNNNSAYSIGNNSRSFAFGGGTSQGGWNNSHSASCESHLMDLKRRERGFLADYNSPTAWADTNVASLMDVRAQIGHYEAKSNGSRGLFTPGKHKSHGFELPASNPFSVKNPFDKS